MQMTNEEILVWLESDDSKSRPYRAARMQVLLEKSFEGNYLAPGGTLEVQAFEEMRQAYLHGLYISCVVSAQIVIEHRLAGMFGMVGIQELEGAGFRKLIGEALEVGFISEVEHELLDQLRLLRNPYVHSKPIMSSECFVYRAAESGCHPFDLFKQDAENALAIVATLCSRDSIETYDDDGVR